MISHQEILHSSVYKYSRYKIKSDVAQGEILPVATRSFGSIGVFAIPEMGRFYRHVLIEKNFPHHGAVAFGHFGKTLYEVFKYIGVDVDEIGFNQPKNMLYKTENPFSLNKFYLLTFYSFLGKTACG